MDGGGIFVVVFIVMAAIWVWQLRQTGMAKSQDDFIAALPLNAVGDVVRDAFGSLLWKDVPGPGVINKRRRSANDSGPVISVDFAPGADGVQVTLWMSHWTSKFGCVFFAATVARQKRKIVRRLT